MSKTGYIQEDFVKTYSQADSKSKKEFSLVFGDKVEILEFNNNWTKVRTLDSYQSSIRYVKGKLQLRDKGILKASMVDVQQGDGLILESPSGKIVFIDGGDNKLFARHAAARYQYKKSSAAKRMDVDAIIITHGDADHFDGLNEIVKSEKNKVNRKRIFINPKRVYHNGLVKSSSKINGKSVPDKDRFGTTIQQNNQLYAIDLYDDTRKAKPEQINTVFKRWHKSMDYWEAQTQQSIDCKRIAYGMDEKQIFDFLEQDDIHVELLGPFTNEVKQNGISKPGLPFLHKHEDGSMMHLNSEHKSSKSISASHTINGHSIAFRLTFGNVRFLFTGDLNKESMETLVNNINIDSKLQCEVLKAPHHGSHDFAISALKKASPIVSIVSSGDEKESKEHIHPRATLLSALGNTSRTEIGVIFITELAAFFKYAKECYTRDSLANFFKNGKDIYTKEELKDLFSGVPKKGDPHGMFYGFERTNYGIIHLRTDGERLLVFTHSGKKGLNEAYSYIIDKNHNVTACDLIKR